MSLTAYVDNCLLGCRFYEWLRGTEAEHESPFNESGGEWRDYPREDR